MAIHNYGASMIIIFIIGLVAGLFISDWQNNTYMETQAIEHNAARYNSQTGDFEWIEEKTQ